MKLAVLFPGIGYHCDKPLLYYSAKLARAAGFEVIPVPYTGFPAKVRGDEKRLRRSIDLACAQSEEILADAPWDRADEILFIGKSIGTLVAARYAAEHALAVRSVLLTPLVETFPFVHGPAIAFHGTADPWADTPAVQAACKAKNIPLILTPGANHSLETGDLAADLATLTQTMARVDAFLRG